MLLLPVSAPSAMPVTVDSAPVPSAMCPQHAISSVSISASSSSQLQWTDAALIAGGPQKPVVLSATPATWDATWPTLRWPKQLLRHRAAHYAECRLRHHLMCVSLGAALSCRIGPPLLFVRPFSRRSTEPAGFTRAQAPCRVRSAIKGPFALDLSSFPPNS